MNVTFPPCPAALPSLELSVYFSNTEQALMQKHIISFFLFKKCIEVSLIYNAVPISTVQQVTQSNNSKIWFLEINEIDEPLAGLNRKNEDINYCYQEQEVTSLQTQ